MSNTLEKLGPNERIIKISHGEYKGFPYIDIYTKKYKVKQKHSNVYTVADYKNAPLGFMINKKINYYNINKVIQLLNDYEHKAPDIVPELKLYISRMQGLGYSFYNDVPLGRIVTIPEGTPDAIERLIINRATANTYDTAIGSELTFKLVLAKIFEVLARVLH